MLGCAAEEAARASSDSGPEASATPGVPVDSSPPPDPHLDLDASSPADVGAPDRGSAELPDRYVELDDAEVRPVAQSCSPFPCASGEFCVESSAAYCLTNPAVCGASPSCVCLLQAVTCGTQCTVDDAGTSTVRCPVPPHPSPWPGH
jgi:hypothetical protein